MKKLSKKTKRSGFVAVNFRKTPAPELKAFIPPRSPWDLRAPCDSGCSYWLAENPEKLTLQEMYCCLGVDSKYFFSMSFKAVTHTYNDHCTDNYNAILKSSVRSWNKDDFAELAMSLCNSVIHNQTQRQQLTDLKIGDSISLTILVPNEYKGQDMFGKTCPYWTIVLKQQEFHAWSVASMYPRSFPAEPKIIRSEDYRCQNNSRQKAFV